MKIGTDGVILGAWAFESYSPERILDVGAGTGLISLMMAQRFPTAQITGIEIDASAASEAAHNIDRSPWRDRISIINGDFSDCDLKHFDAIVSNPPFFTSGLQSPDLQRADARHEGCLSIDKLLERSADILTDGGRLAIILPYERLDKTIYHAAVRHLDVSRIAELSPAPLAQPIRAMIEFTKGLTDTYDRETITIRTASGTYSRRYADLTSEFYL